LGWLSLLLALGCAARSLDPGNPPASGPRALTPVPVDAAELAADDSGIYWTSPASALWVLRPGAETPERLTADAASPTGRWPSPPLLAPAHVFWSRWEGAKQIHRTRKDGTADEVVATTAGDTNLDTDGSNVYWTEDTGQFGGAGVVHALPADAPAGSAPQTLVEVWAAYAVCSLAARGGALYWTPCAEIGATTYQATLWVGTVEALAGGDPGAAIAAAPRDPFALTFAGDDLLSATHPDLYTTSLARLPGGGAPQTIATLPREAFFAGMAATRDWLLVTSTDGQAHAPGQARALRLSAAPLAGGPLEILVDGIRTPAIVGGPGVLFVDASGHLVALPIDEIAATISPGR
jgi:hypothetical protein